MSQIGKYNFSKIWISKLLESKIPFKIENPVLASILNLGLIPNLAFIIFYLIRRDYITTQFLIADIFGLIWINLGPFLIWYYDERLLPKFFFSVLDIVKDKNKIEKLAKKYDTLFSKRFWLITIPWILFLMYMCLQIPETLSRGGILGGVNDFFYWLFLIGIVWVGLITSTGFLGVLITIFAIRDVSKETLKIDPLHPDRLGGLSCIGNYAIGTTILFSTGSLFIPVVFQLISNKGILFFIYPGVLLFSVFILLSFLYPTIKIHHRAKLIRDGILDKLRKKYGELSHKLNTNSQDYTKTVASYLELYRLRSEYLDYKGVSLYPLEIEIFVRLISSVILPIVFLLIQLYLG